MPQTDNSTRWEAAMEAQPVGRFLVQHRPHHQPKKKVQQTKSSNGGHPQKTGEAWMRAAMDVVPCSRPNPGPQPT